MNVLCFITLFLCTSVYITAAIQWEDCGVPLTRKLYFQSVVQSPSKLTTTSQMDDTSISINIGVNIQSYTLSHGVWYYVEVMKDGDLYLNTTVGDLCDTLESANQILCPLGPNSYSFSYKYTLPPLPTGNYTVKMVAYENKIAGKQIGCLQASNFVVGLGLDACSYNSSLYTTFTGTANFLDDNTVVQIGPWGPGGVDLGYPWGTFKAVVATPDLVGYSFNHDNYVWGLRGTLNNSGVANQYDGTVVIGWRPDVNDNAGAELVYQGFFTWVMDTSANPYIFKSGTFLVAPAYYYPEDFPYPLNFGNLGPVFTISQDAQKNLFTISASNLWCRCNCKLGGIGHDDILKKKDDDGMNKWLQGTIAVCVIGGVALIIAIFFIVRTYRRKPRPVVYDDADLMEPQKPDYGTLAMGEAFDAEEQEYN